MFKIKIYHTLLVHFQEERRFVQILINPKQVGNTTLARQVIDYVLKVVGWAFVQYIVSMGQSYKHKTTCVLLKLPSMWTRSYFVSTAGNVSSETIRKYIEEQAKQD